MSNVHQFHCLATNLVDYYQTNYIYLAVSRRLTLAATAELHRRQRRSDLFIPVPHVLMVCTHIYMNLWELILALV